MLILFLVRDQFYPQQSFWKTWGKTLNAISHLGPEQSTSCGVPAWRKTCKQNIFYVEMVWQTQSM